MTDMARVALQLLLERLDPDGSRSRRSRGYWVGSTEQAEAYKRYNNGQLHFDQAVRHAREALASGDAARIVGAALFCASLERTGIEAQRQLGGKKAGAKRRAAAAAKWAAPIAIYEAKVARGEPHLKARQTAMAVKDAPTVKTRQIQNRLPTPRKKCAPS